MKLLLDRCVSGGAALELRSHGHDVVWVGDWEQDPGDREILRIAHAEERILATLDKDFGELAIKEGIPHSGIIQLRRLRARSQARRCMAALEIHGVDLESRLAAIVVVEPGRIRVRR